MRTTTAPVTTAKEKTPWYRPAKLLRLAAGIAGIVLAIAVSPAVRAAAETDTPEVATLWGLLPIGLYAVLALSGMGILASTLFALAAALLLDVPSAPEAGGLVLGSLVNQVTIIGLIIALGAGVGVVLRETGVAQVIVSGVLRLVGDRGPRAVAIGVMLACLILVAALGTLAARSQSLHRC